MLDIEHVKTRAQQAIINTAALNDAVLQGTMKATEEVVGFYRRIYEGKPTDHYHITYAFQKILSKNIEATQNYLRSLL